MNYDLIKELTKKKGLTIKKLGEQIGMSDSGLYTAFINNTLKIDTLEKIANVLGVKLGVFFGEANSKAEILIRFLKDYSNKIEYEDYLTDILLEKEITGNLFDIVFSGPDKSFINKLKELMIKSQIVSPDLNSSEVDDYLVPGDLILLNTISLYSFKNKNPKTNYGIANEIKKSTINYIARLMRDELLMIIKEEEINNEIVLLDNIIEVLLFDLYGNAYNDLKSLMYLFKPYFKRETIDYCIEKNFD